MESGRWNLQDDIRTNVYQVKSLRQASKTAPSVGNLTGSRKQLMSARKDSVVRILSVTLQLGGFTNKYLVDNPRRRLQNYSEGKKLGNPHPGIPPRYLIPLLSLPYLYLRYIGAIL